MLVTYICKACNKSGDGHWHTGMDILDPRCPNCKERVSISTDEDLDNESPTGDDFDKIDFED